MTPISRPPRRPTHPLPGGWSPSRRCRRLVTALAAVSVMSPAVGVAIPAVGAAPAGMVTSRAVAAGPALSAGVDAVRRCRQPGPYELPHGGEPVRLDPADFSPRVTHRFWPMRPGTVWRYREVSGGEAQRVTVTVTRRTRRIAGIRARVVHDVVRSRGGIVENTFDWYAQDVGGNVWYLGEWTREYEDGRVVSTEGSWQHGRDGAQAGMILPARLPVACRWREEFLAGEAEDRAFVLSTRESVRSGVGFHRGVLHTANWTPLEPRLLENKFYGRGVGPVLELDISPSPSRAVLVSMTR